MMSNGRNLPNLIIAGVHKAGTTSLYTYLAKHPEICPSFKKEIGFFVPLMFDRDTPPIEEYASYFRHCENQQFRLDASPSYFYGKDKIASAINKELPDAKVVLLLRDPTDRLISFFSRAISKSTLPADISFKDYLTMSEEKMGGSEYNVYARGIREGLYIDYIQPWQSVFGSNLKVVFFDDLKESALDLTSSICRWLDLDASCFEPQDFTIENRTMQYRHRTLHRYVKDAYMRNEAFWRKNHWLKQRFRGVYNKFNADKDQRLRTIDDESVARLRALYSPYNKKLKSFLESNNYASLPDWLG